MNLLLRRQIMMSVAGVGLIVQPVAATPQGRLIDRAVLSIRHGSAEIGREEFSIRQGRALETGAGFVSSGFTISAAAYYPSSRSYATATSIVHLGPDSQPSMARVDLEGSGKPTLFVDFSARRITVRHRTSAGESASQYPRAARSVVVDDSIMSLFAVLPSDAPGAVTLFYPRTGHREQTSLEDLGTETTLVAGDERRLRHWTLGSGDLLRHLWYDSAGRLIKIEMPAASLIATRIPRT